MKYFGTDGIRNKFSFFDKRFLEKVACAVALLPNCKSIAIAKDTRNSGVFMENVLCETLNEWGINTVKLGIIPSPALAYCLKILECDYGIMLSASHNPAIFNGIKLFEKSGKKLTSDHEVFIEHMIDREPRIPTLKKGESIFADGKKIYSEFLKENFSGSLKGLKVVLDCANGAASNFAKSIFEEAGADVTTFFDSYCGNKINENCGAAHPETLKKICSKEYDIGFSFDGDADRVYACTDNKIYNGDHLMYISAINMLQRNMLHKNTVTGTIMTNSGVESAYSAHGIKFVRTNVGDRNVYLEMEKHGYNLGGEESGHIIFSDYLKTGDGILTALITGTIHKNSPLYVSDNIIDVPGFSDFISAEKDKQEIFNSDIRIKDILSEKHDGVRVVARSSGTEPKIRLMCESCDRQKALNILAYLKKEIIGILYDNKQN